MRRLTSQKKLENQRPGYAFVAPVVIMMAGLLVYPMLYGLYISFFNTNLVSRWNFVGLKYYIEAFTDPEFYSSVLLTLEFMVLVVAGHFIIGFYLATQLNKAFRGRIGYRIIFIALEHMRQFALVFSIIFFICIKEQDGLEEKALLYKVYPPTPSIIYFSHCRH